jgi:hypothetical protein
MYPSTTDCRRLAEYDKRMRFGVSESRQGRKIFIAMFLDSEEVGSPDAPKRMYTHIEHVFGNRGLYGRKGILGSDRWPPGRAVVWRWLDDEEGPFSPQGLGSGDLIAALNYRLKSKTQVNQEERAAAAAKGRNYRDQIEEDSDDFKQFYKYAMRTDHGAHRQLIDKEDAKAGWKRPENQELSKYLDGGRAHSRFNDYYTRKFGYDVLPAEED